MAFSVAMRSRPVQWLADSLPISVYEPPSFSLPRNLERPRAARPSRHDYKKISYSPWQSRSVVTAMSQLAAEAILRCRFCAKMTFDIRVRDGLMLAIIKFHEYYGEKIKVLCGGHWGRLVEKFQMRWKLFIRLNVRFTKHLVLILWDEISFDRQLVTVYFLIALCRLL